MEEDIRSGETKEYVSEVEKGAAPEVQVRRGKEIFRESLVNGNVTAVLGNISSWAGYVREAAGALEQVVELARAALQKQTSAEGIPAQQISLAPDPALFVNLLKTPEFQQVMAVFLVQLLK